MDQTKSYVTEKATQAKNAVNKVAEKVIGTPLISTTATGTVSNTTTILKIGLGDKITSDHPVSTTIGKANGLINLDVATSTEGVKLLLFLLH